MFSVLRWFLVGIFLPLISIFTVAEDISGPWETLRAGDLCLRFPDDWFDITPLARLLLLPEIFAEAGIEGVTVSAAVLRLPATLDEEPAFFMVLLADAEKFPELLASAGTGSRRISRTEGVVAGEAGVYEQYEMDDPAGITWFAYTAQPRPDGRHVVLLAMCPAEVEIPEAVTREMLFSVGPCPPEPSEPCNLCAERLALLEQKLEELQLGYEAQLQALKGEIKTLRQTQGLRVGVVDVETLFTRVFLPQVAVERSALQAKAQAIQDLQSKYAQGQINQDAYQQQYAKLQAEHLQAQVQVNMSMLNKMIASPGFASLRTDLQNLKDQAKPLADQVETSVKQAQVTIIDYTTFFNQLQQLQTAFQQVDQLLTQVAATKILETSQQVAQELAYDLVLRTKDVVIYQRTSAIADLTPEVEKRLWLLFSPRQLP
ncbi:MAG: OmpH family outer membrane protein [Candidatus Bipolaricaulota bacterium]|nr:OmpH family outer membrane protein [Candidatus Bipolaricaulota bacterium]MDW8126922.1 OmpH family outer membrane protein [Candidatus Bipolaricaulota bacterium]